MAKYTVQVDPKPTDTVYVKCSAGLKTTECKIQDETTIELDGEPTEIYIRRETTLLRRFTKWRCRYVTVTLESDEKEFYFPVFGDISSAGKTIKEYSAKLSHHDSSAEREDSLSKNRQFKVNSKCMNAQYSCYDSGYACGP
ncbi:hypothetical protein AAFF_G00001880 [Aldrovandia affinis]|uniref:Uncharacterized protein n=1 Tax=Aldrovandia affinis TaxID=143900 RepID=A0AAD7TD05_9TELE|nr:hypothetical protein AAFF_G00001880 [Aldrovandia affinis]